MIKSDNIGKIAGALVKAQKNMGAALKDAKNPFFKSKYADLSAIIDAAVPVLNENGIAVLQSTAISADGRSVVQTLLVHESGEFIGSDTEIVVAKQNDPQAYGSAISYARRYGLQAMVTLKAEDDDAEGAMGRSQAKDIKATIVAAKEETKAQEVKTEVKKETVEAATTPAKKSGWAKPSSSTKTQTTKSSNEDLF